MVFVCAGCGKQFIYPAKKVVNVTINHKVFYPSETVESRRCPFCSHKVFTEVKETERVISVKSVPLEEVDKWLSEGYVVKELYSKQATLVKLVIEEEKGSIKIEEGRQ